MLPGDDVVTSGLAGLDVDIRIVPEHDVRFRAIPRLKDTLGINVTIASADRFIA